MLETAKGTSNKSTENKRNFLSIRVMFVKRKIGHVDG